MIPPQYFEKKNSLFENSSFTYFTYLLSFLCFSCLNFRFRDYSSVLEGISTVQAVELPILIIDEFKYEIHVLAVRK